MHSIIFSNGRRTFGVFESSERPISARSQRIKHVELVCIGSQPVPSCSVVEQICVEIPLRNCFPGLPNSFNRKQPHPVDQLLQMNSCYTIAVAKLLVSQSSFFKDSLEIFSTGPLELPIVI